ncbi:MAG: hypothetical protein Q9166_000360 [cf. Caloplaca sp. 2 TL-2023]
MSPLKIDLLVRFRHVQPELKSGPSLPQVLSDIKSHQNQEGSVPTPFLGSTLPQVYSFFKSHLRRPVDMDYDHHPFTSFHHVSGRAAVDQECFQPSSPQPEVPVGSPFPTDSSYTILLCSDAPDVDENDENDENADLKPLRLPVAAAFEHLEPVDITPSEAYQLTYKEDLEIDTINLYRPARLIPVQPFTGNEDQEYKLGSPFEMRKRKRQGLRIAEKAEREGVDRSV